MTLILLAIPIITILPVQAGKGQEKLDFLLHLEGLPILESWDRRWQAGVTWHARGTEFEILGDFYVEIGEAGAEETIPKEYLSYEASIDSNNIEIQGFTTLIVREIITIYTDDTQTTERGTLEILNTGINRAGHGGKAIGFGTGEFEGVKILATTTSELVFPPPLLILDRAGTVMGWPTP